MKYKLWISVFFVLMALTFTQTQASHVFYTGNMLVELMREYDRYEAGVNDVNGFECGIYFAYIIGVYDVTNILYDPPNTATKGQIIAVVSKFLKKNPERWSEPASLLVVEALQKAFPLKEKKEEKK